MAKQRPLEIPAVPSPEPFCCSGAARFAEFITKLLADIRRNPGDVVGVNRGKLFLLDRFMAERAGAPPMHRDRGEDQDGRPCLYGLLLAGYAELRDLELSVDPPPLVRTRRTRRDQAADAALPRQAMGLFVDVE